MIVLGIIEARRAKAPLYNADIEVFLYFSSCHSMHKLHAHRPRIIPFLERPEIDLTLMEHHLLIPATAAILSVARITAPLFPVSHTLH